MFRGINAINLDAKGRMAMPARYRAPLDRRVVLTIDTEDPCLLLYPQTEWEKIEANLQALPSFNRAARRIQRLLIGHATELELDGNGRILLPPLLREYASLDKRVILVGQGKKFEIWSDNQWEQSRADWLSEESINPEELPDELKSLAL